MTIEELYQKYRSIVCGGSGSLYKKERFVERLVGANGIMDLFLSNFCGAGIETTHIIVILFTIRAAREEGIPVIPSEKILKHRQNPLGEKRTRIIAEWAEGDDLSVFPDLGAKLCMKCDEDQLAGEELGPIEYSSHKPISKDKDLLSEWGLKW